MQQIKVRTHLIVSEVHDEYQIKWCGKIAHTNPALDEKGLPTFIIISSDKRVELHTVDMKQIEDCAKRIASPRGRKAITADVARIYIKEQDDKQTLVGLVTKFHIKKFQQMYDPVGYKGKDF